MVADSSYAFAKIQQDWSKDVGQEAPIFLHQGPLSSQNSKIRKKQKNLKNKKKIKKIFFTIVILQGNIHLIILNNILL